MKKIIIISGGKAPSKELLEKELENSSYLIAADSGANCLYSYNIVPDFLMGDFDSVDKEVLNYFKTKDCKVETFPKDKDYTDTGLALEKAKELGAQEIVLLGCTGSRIDHVMGNVGLLLKCLKRGIKAYLKDDSNVIMLTDKEAVIKGNIGEYFSLQSYGMEVTKLSIKGCKFPLIEYNLELGDGLTISNEFAKNEVKITFKSGILMILICKD